MGRRTDGPRLALSAVYWLFVLYLLGPLLLMTALSFKDANFIAFPLGDVTLGWYMQVVQDQQFLSALWYSIVIAVAVTLLSTIVGVWIAMLISAISIRIFVATLDIPTGTGAIILGHSIHAVPFVMIMALTRLRTMPPNLVDAARDLGADGFVAFWRITLPYLKPAIYGGMVFAALLSIDDFVRTFFLGGYRTTIPMLMFAKLQSGLSPDINAMATLILIATAIVGLYAEYATRRARSR